MSRKNNLKFISSHAGVTSLSNYHLPEEVYKELPDTKEIIEITYESCKNEYKSEEERKKALEDKAQNILNIISLIIIITFGLANLSNFFQAEPLIVGGIQFWLQPLVPSSFVGGLSSILLAVIFAIRVIRLKEYKYPFEEVVCFDNRSNESLTILKIITAKLLLYVSENRKLNGGKISNLRTAHFCFTFGIILLGVACIIFLLVYL